MKLTRLLFSLHKNLRFRGHGGGGKGGGGGPSEVLKVACVSGFGCVVRERGGGSAYTGGGGYKPPLTILEDPQ